jgi:predicted nicotinamide N-methyase
MFRLITTVRRGTALDLAAAWPRYPSIEAARAGASALMREDRVLRVMVVRNDITRTFVEWSDR